ncbi:MAG TPA: hypothetical protein VKI45_03175 [Allosphingosinicella sp.]|nr:hypothetical protein [Allosphingosinicella sp.]
MAEFRNQSFDGATPIETDGNHYLDCNFREATFVYRGGGHPRFDRCTFHSCGWEFAGPALTTIQFLQQMNIAPGGDALIAQIFRPGAYLQE